MRAARRAADGEPRRRADGGNLQAWARERALRRGASCSAARRRRRDRPHRHRPGRDGALPARRLAGPARAARDGGARRPASCARCWRSRARRRRRTAPSAGCRGARTRPTPRRRFARNRARAELVPALRELHPAAEANVLRTLATAARRGRGARRAASTRSLEPDDAGARWPRSRPRSRGCACSGSPTTPPRRAGAGRGPAGRGDARARRARRQRLARPRRRPARGRPSTGGCASSRGAAAPAPPSRRGAAGARPRRVRGGELTCEVGADLAGRRRHARPRRARRAARGPRLARRRPHAPARRSAAAARCRTSSPTARSRARGARACPWSSSRAARSPGSPAWRPASASGSRAARGAARAWPGIRHRCGLDSAPVLRDESIGEILVQADDLQHRVRAARRARSRATTRARTCCWSACSRAPSSS